MELVCIRISNFRSFGPEAAEIGLSDITFLLGPNGAGKTAVLQALSRMFGLDPSLRRILPSDFHVPAENLGAAVEGGGSLWIEADFELPELEVEDVEEEDSASVAASFAHLRLIDTDGPAQVRFRLAATIDVDGDIEEKFTCVIEHDDGMPTKEAQVSKQDRNAIQVHYLPARRNPADHISYAANALLGRLLRSIDWSAERDAIEELTEQIGNSIADNTAIASVADALGEHWSGLHKGDHFADPAVSFARGQLEAMLRHLSIGFTPGHGEALVDFSSLSDGQQSLLYVSLVLAIHDVGQKVLRRELDGAFDIDKLRPAVYTLIAIEEPENSLSPHYLGRVIKSLNDFSEGESCQAVVATHSPSLLKRVEPESVRYLRLNEDRETIVKEIELPSDDDGSAQKFVREGIQAFPELYFSRLVVLGEGDSEEIVLPRLMAARGILTDDASVSVAPLGGRHVNHFWRLLHGLGIPHVTLLDLDLARYQGGWGRVSYAVKQLDKYADISPMDLSQEDIDGIPAWSEVGLMTDDHGWCEWLEERNVFFSSPLDIDFMMIRAYPEAYGIDDAALRQPNNDVTNVVLGTSHGTVAGQYSTDETKYFGKYQDKFKRKSKPASHLSALAELSDEELLDGMPDVLGHMFDRIEEILEDLPE